MGKTDRVTFITELLLTAHCISFISLCFYLTSKSLTRSFFPKKIKYAKAALYRRLIRFLVFDSYIYVGNFQKEDTYPPRKIKELIVLD